MMRPGDRLRAAAARVCSARTMERVIDPVIADLQCEHAASDRMWQRQWIRLAGYFAFWKTACLHTGQVSSGAALEWLSAENWAIGRTLAASGLAISAVTALLLVPSAHGMIFGADGVYLVPSALAVGLPFGFMGGVLFAWRGRVATRHSTRSIVAIAIVLTAIQFASLNWIVPSANQTFRVQAQQAIHHGPALARGYNEMSFGELKREATAQQTRGLPDASFVLMQYDLRWALGAAPMILGFFALALATGRRGIVSPAAIVIATQLACMTYFDLAGHAVRTSDALRLAGGPVILMLAWMPNLICASWATLLMKRRA